MPTGYNNPLGKIRPGYTKGDLTVIRQATEMDKNMFMSKIPESERNAQIRFWVVQCVCGELIVASTTRMHCKNTKSCGCKRYRDMERPVTNSTDPVDMVRRNCFTRARATAKRREIEWTLHYDDFVRLGMQSCHYCKCPPSNCQSPTDHQRRSGIEPIPYVYSGLDRVNSDLGYHVGNVVPCCCECNRAKCDLTLNEFKQHLNDMHTNWTDACLLYNG